MSGRQTIGFPPGFRSARGPILTLSSLTDFSISNAGLISPYHRADVVIRRQANGSAWRAKYATLESGSWRACGEGGENIIGACHILFRNWPAGAGPMMISILALVNRPRTGR